jgi:DNA polymerase IV (archaeal DinB-like DNA polymerase)
LKYYIGCKGWRNERWSREFFPHNLYPNDYLTYYSKVFDFVEIDLSNRTASSNDRLHDDRLFRKWATNTPHDFRFTIKLPEYIIEDTYKVDEILEELAPLEGKVLAIIIQPPNPIKLTLANGREWLDDVVRTCAYHGYSVAFEFNHSSWFQDLTYNLLHKHKAAIVWSSFSGRYCSSPIMTADFLYFRINGNEQKWIEKIKEKESELNIVDKVLNFTIVVVDNPTKANHILKLLDLPTKKYSGGSQWVGKVIMHLDLDSFFPSCEELRDPMLKGKAHAVIMTDETKDNITKGAVASCSYAARKYGVRSAMSLFTAKQLCPQLILNPVDKSYYQEISGKIMNLIEEYADVLEQASIDEAYLDCTKKIADTQVDIKQYAIKIKDTVGQQYPGLLSSIGVAPTKSAAKIASDFKKPDGLTIIYTDQLEKFFENLEVHRIAGIGTKTRQALKDEMRIQTIGQLANCDVQKLMDRFGKKIGLWMWQVANGRDSDFVVPREDNISISTEETLDRATSDKKKIVQYLNGLVDEVYERVRGQGYEFRTVGVKLVRSDYSIDTREVSFPNSRNDRKSIALVLEKLVDRFSFNDSNTTIVFRKVGIKITNLIRVEKKKPPEQKTLLDYF